MPNEPQTPNPSTTNIPSSNPNKTAPVGDNMKKDEPAVKPAAGMQEKPAAAAGDKPKSSNY